MKIIKGTTPQLCIHLRQDGTPQEVIFSIQAGETMLERRVTDIPADGVYRFGLTQEETLSMQAGQAILEAQINYADGNVAKSERFLFKVRDSIATEMVSDAEGTREQEEITLTVASEFSIRACYGWSEAEGAGAVEQLGGNAATGRQSAALGSETLAASPMGTTQGYLTTTIPCTRYLSDDISMVYDPKTRQLTFTFTGEEDAPEGKVFVVYRCYITELDNYIYRRATFDALPGGIDLSSEGTVETDDAGEPHIHLLFAGEIDGEVMDGTVTKESLYAPRAVGYATVAVGKSAEASGYLSVAWKPCAHAEGYRTRALGDAAHAEGAATLALADRSHAEGIETHAIGGAAHAEGKSTMANGFCSHAEGVGTISDAFAGHVQGCYNEVDADNKYLHIVGNGSSEERRSNAHTLDKEGNAWFAGAVACREPRTDGEAATRSYVDARMEGRLTDSIAFLRGLADEGAVTGTGVSFVEGELPEGKAYAGGGSYVTKKFIAKNAEVVKKVQWSPKDAHRTGRLGIWLCAEQIGNTLDANGFLPVDVDWSAGMNGVVGTHFVTNSAGTDTSFIFKNAAGSNDKYRFCDANRELVYKFDLATYPNALVVMDICQNYLVQVSPDHQNWVTVQNYEVASGGRINNDKNPVQLGISALRWTPGAAAMYIRLANTDTTSGFGGAISGFTVYSGIGQDASIMVELTDSGKPDVNELSFSLGTQIGTLSEGWNFYQLDLRHSATSGQASAGTVGYYTVTGSYPAIEKLNYFRVYGTWDLWKIKVGQCAVKQEARTTADTEFFE